MKTLRLDLLYLLLCSTVYSFIKDLQHDLCRILQFWTFDEKVANCKDNTNAILVCKPCVGTRGSENRPTAHLVLVPGVRTTAHLDMS